MKQWIRGFWGWPARGGLTVLAGFAVLCLAPQCGYAQGGQYSTIALNVLGRPLPGINIAVRLHQSRRAMHVRS